MEYGTGLIIKFRGHMASSMSSEKVASAVRARSRPSTAFQSRTFSLTYAACKRCTVHPAAFDSAQNHRGKLRNSTCEGFHRLSAGDFILHLAGIDDKRVYLEHALEEAERQYQTNPNESEDLRISALDQGTHLADSEALGLSFQSKALSPHTWHED